MQTEYLAHHGIKGMKWGVRRAKKNQYNSSYTDKQRKQDRAIYGQGAERRINRRMNDGYGVKGARALEADRAARINKAKTTGKRVAKGILKGTGAVAGYVAYDYLTTGGRGTRNIINNGLTIANNLLVLYSKVRV